MNGSVQVSHGNTAYAGMPGPVRFDPPVSLAADVRFPACPACGEGTVILFVCGRCGSRDGSPSFCCQESMLVRGVYVSLLPGMHAAQGCPLV